MIICFSKFGNTGKIAEAIAETLDSKGRVRVISTDQFSISDLKDVELVVMRTPTHRMSLPEAVRPVFETLPRGVLRDKRIAAFDTSYKMSWWLTRFSAARKLDRKLRRLGGKRVAPPETFHVIEREGPLYEGEIERAKEWAASILGQLEAQGG